VFTTGANRSQNKRVCELLGITNGGTTFPVLPPILFSRENPKVMSRLFFHPSLFRVTIICFLSYVLGFSDKLHHRHSSRVLLFTDLLPWPKRIPKNLQCVPTTLTFTQSLNYLQLQRQALFPGCA
jgi:hypothetical protein